MGGGAGGTPLVDLVRSYAASFQGDRLLYRRQDQWHLHIHSPHDSPPFLDTAQSVTPYSATHRPCH